jgi:hypothetical protein
LAALGKPVAPPTIGAREPSFDTLYATIACSPPDSAYRK